MPAISNIVISDGQPTPVAHTFSPVGINSDQVASYDDRSSGVAVGYNNLTISLRKPVAGANVRNFKAQVKLVLPTTETLSGTTFPSKAYECLANIDFVINERASLQNRKDLLALVKNALSHATITSVVQDLENVW